MSISAVSTPAQVGTSNQAVRQHIVDLYVSMCRADASMGQSELANMLRNPNLSDDEKTAVLQELARGDESGLRSFYANDVARSGDSALTEDQREIGRALQAALDNGDLNADDLLRIADFNKSGNGAQRFLDTLSIGGRGGAGGAVETLADALWSRNEGVDRAVAAIAYSSDPALQSRNLNTPAKRREAFEAVVAFNEADPNNNVPGTQSEVWRNAGLRASGSIFASYGTELVDHYTGAKDGVGQTEVLAKFMSQTVLNPQAQGIWLDRSRDLVPTIQNVMARASSDLADRALKAPPGSMAEQRAMSQFGRLTASVSGAAALALTRYSDQIKADEATRAQFAGMVGSLVGKTPLGKVPLASNVVTEIVKAVMTAMADNPERPDAAIAGVLFDTYSRLVNELAESNKRANLPTAFDAAYAAELLNLQQNLNVNLGGHK